jgi:predicted O-methyltransferase YrrM
MPEESIIAQFDNYVNDLLAHDDDILTKVRANMAEAGLPSIAVSPSEGAMLRGLVQLSGASRILEIGTLGGYSAIQMARAMKPGGKIVSLELSDHHASVARKNIELAGFSESIEVRVGPAAETLKAMNVESGLPLFDLAFIDADKPGYPEYLDLSFPLIRPGGLILSDNTLQESVLKKPLEGMGIYNAKVLNHPHLTSFMLPVLRGDHVDGLLVSIKKG